MGQKSMIDDKRREPRFPINATVKVISSEHADPIYGVCCNVSANGLQIQIDTALAKDELLSLEIHDGGVTFNADAEVAHSTRVEGGYLIGFKANFEPALPDSFALLQW